MIKENPIIAGTALPTPESDNAFAEFLIRRADTRVDLTCVFIIFPLAPRA